ncbi:hypothetical protein ACN4EG_25215 [Alkalinema pantanalense CENA528]|uniref:hypothetical protein n=1 Tax=Alkalinema pantanalense TaxID=1620705 RepID=UPI003D6E1F17
MSQTTTTQPLTYFADSPEIRKVCEIYGDRLGVLSGIEKHQLVMVLAGTLAHWRWLAEQDTDDEDDEFAELFEQDDSGNTICGWAAENICDSILGDVMDVAFLLESCQPEKIAAILPAIAQYAAEDDR